jgi:hypothetical protein
MSEYVRIRQDTSGYVRMRQHTCSVSPAWRRQVGLCHIYGRSARSSTHTCHTSCASIRQRTSAYVSTYGRSARSSTHTSCRGSVLLSLLACLSLLASLLLTFTRVTSSRSSGGGGTAALPPPPGGGGAAATTAAAGACSSLLLLLLLLLQLAGDLSASVFALLY